MYVRIARFEGGDAAQIDEAVEGVRRDAQGPPPPGLEGVKRLLMLVDREHGRSLGLTFFESEEDLRRGDEALNAMSPDGEARRTSVEFYEVAIDQQPS